MPLWVSQIRAAVHSTTFRQLSRPTKCQFQWHNLRPKQRNYTTALAERPRDEQTIHGADAQRPSLWGSDYVDFVLDGYGSTKQANRDEATREGSPPGDSKKERRRARGPIKPRPSDTVRRARLAARLKIRRQGKGEKTRLVSIRSELRTSAVYSSAWSLKYAIIVRPYDKVLSKDHSVIAEPTFSDDALEWTKEVVNKLGPDAAFSLTDIARRTDKLEREVWSEVALYLLRYEKPKLMDFLSATNVPLYPPINWVEDCLEALARHYTMVANLDGVTRAHGSFRKLLRTFIGLVDRETKEQFVFAGSFIRHLLPYCTTDEVNELWSIVKLQKVRIAGYALLHFADYFGKHNQLERSLDALLEARGAGIDTDSVPFRMGCSTLLRLSCAYPDGLRVCMRLIEHLVSIGIRLTTRIYNIIILNAVEVGDLETAHSLYSSMREQGFEPNDYTSAIRLKACKLDIDNAGLLTSVIQDAITFGEVRTNPTVSGEILHCLALHHTKHNPTAAFNTLAAAYAQFYDPSPLERLGLKLPKVPLPAHQDAMDSSGQAPASTWALGHLLSVYLNLNAGTKEVVDLYNRWRELVEAGDTALAPCAAIPHFSNMFLSRLTRSKSTLLHAAQVVKDMQRALPESAGVTQAGPDVYTWSIFAHGFARHGETKLAEQVFGYMRNKGIEPNHVTWTSLIGSYAAAQDAEGLMDAIRGAEQSGDVWDHWTHSNVDRFRDKQKLRELLERQKFESSMDFSSELKNDLGRRMVETPAEAGDALGTAVDGPNEEDVVQGDTEGHADTPSDLVDRPEVREPVQ